MEAVTFFGMNAKEVFIISQGVIGGLLAIIWWLYRENKESLKKAFDEKVRSIDEGNKKIADLDKDVAVLKSGVEHLTKDVDKLYRMSKINVE